jgi:hypothetical protein
MRSLCRKQCDGQKVDTDYEDRRFSIELLDDDASGQQVLAREDRIDVAYALYRLMEERYPGSVIVLLDGERVLERGDEVKNELSPLQ